MEMVQAERDEQVERVRSFNRRWTEVLGLLDQGLLATDLSLTEARVLFELGAGEETERMDLRERLAIDASFLTRVLGRLEARELVRSTPSVSDPRRLTLQLTDAGRAAFADLDARSARQIGELLEPLSADRRHAVVEAMTMLTATVGPSARRPRRDVSVRSIRAGDLGWVVQRHGALYASEYGWNLDFEALVAKIVADFQTGFRPGREDAWIAEVDGARAGCVFCCQRDEQTAQLRILLVEPWARGLGIGARLVDECIRFARGAGYPTMVLWTNDVLVSARRIYEAAGFRLVEEEHHHSFGHDLVGQNWELDLTTT